MFTNNAEKSRTLVADGGILFLWCWLLGFGHAFAMGYPDLAGSLGGGFALYLIGLIALLVGWRSPNRLRNAVLVATGAFGLAMLGIFSKLIHP
ncbi:hypothetical protein ACKU27_12000 [Sphingobium yanoikuyae]|uniref:hypothetical protein n=1 Tax=Sphingobium yanoikuyae TaxID=13690 RepID=UPI003B915CAC